MALTLSMLMWLVAFLSVGGEWFLMWQSHTWNGRNPHSACLLLWALCLLLLLQPDTESQP